MVKRYTVSVSDELGQRIDEWKGKISPSTIFQEGMQRAISSEERLQAQIQGGNDMTAILERLKAEKQEEENMYREAGRNAGLEWAKTARHRELKSADAAKEGIVDFYNKYGGIPYHHIQITDSIGDGIKDVFEDDPLMNTPVQLNSVLDACLSSEATEWFLGWLEGVEAFWSEVKDKL